MNELNRMQYLGAMGIDTFVPRRLLPAAKVPVACALPIEWVSEAVAEGGTVVPGPSTNSFVAACWESRAVDSFDAGKFGILEPFFGAG